MRWTLNSTHCPPCLALAVLLLAAPGFPTPATAQDYAQSARTTLSWSPAAGENGVDATVEVQIRYRTFFGEPTVNVVAEATKGNTIYLNGQRYTRADVGEDAWDDIDFGPINLEADIYQGSQRITTVQFRNIIGVDISASPDWDEVFPGLNREQAIAVFKQGFQIRNIQLVGMSVDRMYAVERVVREKQEAKQYAGTVQEADALFAQQNYDEAITAYRRASEIKGNEDYPRERIREIQDIQREAERAALAQQKAEAALEAEEERLAAEGADEDQETAQVEEQQVAQVGTYTSDGGQAGADATGQSTAEAEEAAAEAAARAAEERRRAEAARLAAEEQRRRIAAEERRQAAAEGRETIGDAAKTTMAAGGTMGGYMAGEEFGMFLGMIDEKSGFLFHMGTNDAAMVTGEASTVDETSMTVGAEIGFGLLGTNVVMPYLGYEYSTGSGEGEEVHGLTYGAMGYLFNAIVYQFGLNASGDSVYGLGLQFEM